jgi:hypothetical protein
MVSAAGISPPGAGGREGPSRLRYLIARRKGNRLEVLTLTASSSRETLPVFTGAGAARDFLRYAGGDWRVRESTAGELVSLLVGFLPHVDRIVLDPVFGFSAGDAEPRSATREEFVAVLMGERLAARAR